MEYKVDKYEIYKNIGEVNRGPRLNSVKQTNNSNIEKVKILNWPNLKKLCEGQSLDDIESSLIDMSRKNKKSDMYLKKGDIVIPVFPNENGKNVIYIEGDFNNYIYGELVFVLRLNENSPISSQYLYMILSSESFIKKILELSKGESALRHRLTNEILDNLMIPILNDESMKILLDDYTKIKQLEKEIKQRNKDFNNKIEQINNVYTK